MASPVSTYAALVNFYKVRYPDRKLKDLAFAPFQFLKAVKKDGNKVGQGFWHPVKHSSAGNTYRRFDAAMAVGSYTSGGPRPSDVTRFFIDVRDNYSKVSVEDKAIYRSKNNEGAWIRARESELEAGLTDHMQKIAYMSWGDGSGRLAQVGSYAAGPPKRITLLESADTYKFHVGMKLQTVDGATAHTGVSLTLQDSGAVLTVTAVDYDAGTIDVTGTTTSIGTNDHIFIYGDAHTDATRANQMGVAGWIPLDRSGLATENFLSAGVGARAVNPTLLAGHSQSFLGTIEETLKRLDTKMYRRNPSIMLACWMSFTNLHRLEIELQGRVTRDDGKDAKFGLPGLVYMAPRGPIKIMGDSFLEDDRFYLLDMSTWELCHLEGVPHIITTDGQQARAEVDSDAIAIRLRSWTELLCTDPAYNGVGAIS